MTPNLALLQLAEIARRGHEHDAERLSLIAAALQLNYPRQAERYELDAALLREVDRHQLQFSEMVREATEAAK